MGRLEIKLEGSQCTENEGRIKQKVGLELAGYLR
jgi:hypothetical protein